MNILFLCTGNSCRSILAEALFRSMAPAGVSVQSAGSRPAGFVHPQALATLERASIDTTGLSSKSWAELPVAPDVVITLCAEAEGEECPLYLGTPVRSHWGMPDPAKTAGDAAAVAAAFADTLTVLRRRIEAMILLLNTKPFCTPRERKADLDAIAHI